MPLYDDAADDPDRDAIPYSELSKHTFDAAMAGDPEYEALRFPRHGDVLMLALDPEGDVPEGWTRDGDIIWRAYDETVSADPFVDAAAWLPQDGTLLRERGIHMAVVTQVLGWVLVAFVGLVLPALLLLWVMSL